MAGLRINIMELRQITRLIKKGTNNRKVADMLKISRNTVKAYVRIFEAHDLDYSDLIELDDAALLALFPCRSEIEHHRYKVLSCYSCYFDSEFKKPGCTLETL
jgi:predicted transcriptional regulator